MTSIISLQACDGVVFTIDKEVIEDLSGTVRELLDETDDFMVPLPTISSEHLPLIIEFCIWSHSNKADSKDESVNNDRETWTKNFVNTDKATLYALITAADFMNIKPLLDLTGQTIADMMIGKTPDEIRAEFGIVKDLTPEEEAQIISENTWGN